MDDQTYSPENPFAKKKNVKAPIGTDRGYSPDNPFAKKALSPKPETPKVQEPDSFSNQVGNLKDFIGSVFQQASDAPNQFQGHPLDAVKYLGSNALDVADNAVIGAGVGLQNLSKTVGETSNSIGKFIHDTPITQMPSAALDKALGLFQGLPSAGGMAGALVDQFVTQPIEAATQMKNDNGVAVPMTPEELAQRYQSVAATLTMGEVAKATSGALLATNFKTAQAALAAQKVSRVGKLAKVIGADAIAGTAAGAYQGAVAGLGSEDDIAKSIAGALTFMPIGAALGLFGVKKYTGNIDKEVGRLTTNPTFDSARQLAALHSLKATDYTSMTDLAGNIDAINTSDNLVNAAIKAKLKIGKGYVVEGYIPKEEKLPDMPGAFAYYSPTNNSLLASPNKLSSTAETFFHKVGFLPREVVNFGGNDHYVVGPEGSIDPSIVTKVKRIKLKSVVDGAEVVAPIDAIRRSNTSLVTSEFKAQTAQPRNVLEAQIKQYQDMYDKFGDVKDIDGNVVEDSRKTSLKATIDKLTSQLDSKPINVSRAGLLNSENFASTLADKFVKMYKMSKGSEPFDQLLGKFAQNYGIKVEEHPDFQSIVYKKISDDLANDHLSPKEKLVRKRLQSDLKVLNEGYQDVLTSKVAQGALSNGMYMQPDGGGRYTIRDRTSATPLAIVGSTQEALDYINKSGQGPLLMNDGALSGGVPTNIGNLGGMQTPYTPEYSKRAQIIDRIRVGGIVNKIVPSVRLGGVIDNITRQATQFTKDIMLPLQDLQNQRRNFTIKNDPLGKHLHELNLSSVGLTPEQLEHVANARETFTPEEIKASYLSRPMLTTEINAATNWFKKTSTKDVADLMYSTRALHNFEIGTPEFEAGLKLVSEGNPTKYTKQTLAAAQNMSAYARQFTPSVFSLQAVFKLGKALEDPATALNKQDYAAKYFTTDRQDQLLKKLNDYYNSFDIPEEQKIAGYLPDIVANQAVNFKGTSVNPTFARELARAGITPDNLTIRDPLEQARRYYYSYVNSKSGFLDGVIEAQKKLKNNIDVLRNHPDPKIAALADPTEAKINEHLNDVLGRPKADEIFSKISQTLLSKLGIRTPDIGSVLAAFSLSNLGLRQGLAIRDGHNALGQAYIRYGHEFAEKAFAGALSDSYLKGLQDKGILPRQDAMTIFDPSNPQGLLGKETLTGKVASAGFKWSGQEAVYNRTLAGLYKATMDVGAPILESLRKNEITKIEAYKKLNLNIEGPTIARAFDEFVTQGRPDQALDLLGRWRGRTTSTLFGNNNNPIGWKSPVGRLLGQYGAWSTNSFNTMLENAAYGDKGEVAGRILRSGIVYGATAAAGSALGLDLHKWQFENPFEVIPGVGPVSTLLHDAVNTYGKDPNALHAAFSATGGVLKDFVPYRKFVSDWQKAYESGNPMVGILNAPLAK